MNICAPIQDTRGEPELAPEREREPTLEELRARNARWEFYGSERVHKGRPRYRTVYRQWRPDWKHYPVRDAVAPDPILNLLAARQSARLRPCDPEVQQRYGELLQLVVSPAFLPDGRMWRENAEEAKEKKL